ncbi:MAG: ester cyclase [Acidimicrobiia bacterium]|nr:ester cyclase [Acidimicrobiia bacterium]
MADLKSHADAVLDAFNTGDLDRYMELVGNSVYSELATGRTVSGDDLRAALAGWKTAFPDATGTVTNTVEVGDTIVQEVTWTGTHTGPMMTPEGEIPATGAHQTTPAVMVSEYEGDQLKATRHYFDLMGLMAQLGLT